MSMIDLSTMAAPDVVQPLDFEAVLLDLRAELLQRYPAAADVIDLESEPLRKLLEVAAYREVLLRQRVNEAARSVMLAYAGGTDLEHLGANIDIERLAGEDDTRLRGRVQKGYNRLAAAGPLEAYRQHALAVSADIIDVDVFSEAPGRVTVTLLAREAVTQPSDEARAIGAALFGIHSDPAFAWIVADAESPMLRQVLAALNAEHVRPLTDHVVVRPSQVQPIAVAAVLEVLPGPDPTVILARRRATLEAHLRTIQTAGHDVTRAAITAALVEPGVKDVRLMHPAENLVLQRGQLAAVTSISLMFEVVHA